MKVKYWTFYSIWIWSLFVLALMFMYLTDKDAWGSILIYVFLLVCHYAYYKHNTDKEGQLCCCGHSKEAHGASSMSWAEAQERSRMGDTRYVDYHDDCQCLTYVPSIRWMNERKIA